MRSILITLTLAFTLLASNDTMAQKFGYINLGNLLEEMQERKAADTELKAYQEGLISQGEAMMKKLEANYNKYAEDAKSGILTDLQKKQREAEITAERDKIAAFEQEVQQKILKKREDLLKPILLKVDTAIQAVGKESGYTMIFDVSVGAMLFAQDGDDVMDLVKAKLGL